MGAAVPLPDGRGSDFASEAAREYALAAGRPAGAITRLRVGAATVARDSAGLDKTKYALNSTPQALLAGIERPYRRSPCRLTVVTCQR